MSASAYSDDTATSGGCWPSGSPPSPATAYFRSRSPPTCSSRPNGGPTRPRWRPYSLLHCCRSRSWAPSSQLCSTGVSRQQVLVVVISPRAAVASRVGGVGGDRAADVGCGGALLRGLLLAMSLNRFLLAALSASLPHTIDPSEYMVANSVVPTVGSRRLCWSASLSLPCYGCSWAHVMPDYRRTRSCFWSPPSGFVLSAVLASSVPRRRLGPDR